MIIFGDACGIQTDSGLELLLHVGLDTVNMNGDGFELHVKKGDRVKQGDKLITFSKERIQNAGYQDITMLVITGMGDVRDLTFISDQEVKAGERIADIDNGKE